jgi:glycerophosphoryl diester phosphodiesterase
MRRALKVIGIVILLYLSSLLLYLFKSGQDNIFMVSDFAPPLIIAHGGAKALFPENTMVAFDGCDSIGVDVLEMDVLLTKDGVLITHHSETIDHTTEATGAVIDYTFEELGKFNFGDGFIDLNGVHSYRGRFVAVTRLEDVLSKYGSKYPLCIELKNKERELGQKAANELWRLLQKYQMTNKVIISCFDDAIVSYFKKISEGKVHTATAVQETNRFVTLNKLHIGQFYGGDDDVLQIPVVHGKHRLDEKRIINNAHRKNMAVHYWTVNDSATMKQLIDKGVDGIITDRPDIMKRLLLLKR